MSAEEGAGAVLAVLLDAYRSRVRDLADLVDSQVSPATKLSAVRDCVVEMLREDFPGIVEAQHRQVGPLEPAQCRTCGAEIVWVRTVNGKAAPCDARKRTITTADGRTVAGHESHFASCPQRAQHRRAR